MTKTGIVVQIDNLSTWEDKTAGSQVQGQSGLRTVRQFKKKYKCPSILQEKKKVSPYRVRNREMLYAKAFIYLNTIIFCRVIKWQVCKDIMIISSSTNCYFNTLLQNDNFLEGQSRNIHKLSLNYTYVSFNTPIPLFRYFK